MRQLSMLLIAAVSILGCASLDTTADTAAARPASMAHPQGHRPAVRASVRSRRDTAPRRDPRAGARVPRGSARQRSAPTDAIKVAHGRARTLSPAAAGARDRAAAIAAVLATPCENTGVTPEPANIEIVRAAVLCLVNQERAQNGESPLRLSAQLQQAAQSHGDELVSGNYFEHVSPSGLTPVERIRGTGYIPGPAVGYVIGENLAWGTYGLSTAAAIVSAWIASPGHLANILESHYSETGIGVTPQVPASFGNGAAGATYAQEFGVIIH